MEVEFSPEVTASIVSMSKKEREDFDKLVKLINGCETPSDVEKIV